MEYNPLLPEVKANLYNHYAYLREHAPMYWVEPLQCWAISRYDDVAYVLKNPQVFSSAAFFKKFLGEFDPVPEVPWLITTDPPAHLRLRKLANKGFMPGIIRDLTQRVGEITNHLIAQLRTKREFDFVREFSAILPVTVIAEMLGVEPERGTDFKRWTDDLIRASNRAAVTAPDHLDMHQSMRELRAYFEEAIAQRRKRPTEDLISAFILAEEENQMLTASEVLSLAIILLLGGNETTTNLLGNTIVTLLEAPEELSKVRQNPSLIPQLIEEILRYRSPVQALYRQTTQEVEIAGTTIPAGATVMILLASANRDPRKFADPDRFNLARNTDGHLAFGHGVHFCLGAPLARLEAKVGLEAIFRSLPPFVQQEAQVTWLDSFFIHGPQRLPLAFAPA